MPRDPYRYFRIEGRDLATQLGAGVLGLEREGNAAGLALVLRLAHTLKGAARVVRHAEIAGLAHDVEEVLAPFRESGAHPPKAALDAVLALADTISNRVADLRIPQDQAPSGGEAPPAPRSAAAPLAGIRIVSSEVEDIDALIAGIAEARAQAPVLAGGGTAFAEVRRQAAALRDRLSVAPGLESAVADAAQLEASIARIERGLSGAYVRVNRELSRVRDAAEQLRLVPCGTIFAALERTARDAATALGKMVRIELDGADVRLDAPVALHVRDALIQLVRNAVAHGIESPGLRTREGKPADGRISIAVVRRGSQVAVICHDDGAGIDVDGLRRQAGNGAGPGSAGASSGDLAALLLGGRASTAREVTEEAGRGIGMDVIRAAIERLGAGFAATTERGRGTTFELIVPTSVSAIEAQLVEAGGIRAGIPQGAVRMAVRLRADSIQRTAAGEGIVHEGEVVPLAALSALLGRPGPARREGDRTALLIEGTDGLCAISVDRLLGGDGLVARTLPSLAPATPIVAGASLDGSATPVLVLDPQGLVAAARTARFTSGGTAAARRPLLVIDDSLTTRMLERSILESAGYQVDLATSGEEGLERARNGTYALILCDVEMPGMDGFTFVEQIRRDRRLRRTPAILVTSRNAPEDRRRGLEAGAQGYVVKSEFDQAALLDHISRLVS